MKLANAVQLFAGGPGSGRHPGFAREQVQEIANRHEHMSALRNHLAQHSSHLVHDTGHRASVQMARANLKHWIKMYRGTEGADTLKKVYNGMSVPENYNPKGPMDPRSKLEKAGRLSSGGIGSGRKPTKGWSKMSEEERRKEASKDPRQQKLFPEKVNAFGMGLTNPKGFGHGHILTPPKLQQSKHGHQVKAPHHGFHKPNGSVGTTSNWSGKGFRHKKSAFARPKFGINKPPGGSRRPNQSMHADKGGEPMVGNMSRQNNHETKDWFQATPGNKGGVEKKVFADGEPSIGTLGYGSMDHVSKFHPPSLKKPQRVPADNPGEKDNRFLDVDKRKEAQKMRLDRLRRSAPGGLPAQIPVRTTGVEQHMGVYQFSAQKKKQRIIQRPAKLNGESRRSFTPYRHRGSA